MAPARAKPDAGAIIQPETAQSSTWGLGCFAGNLRNMPLGRTRLAENPTGTTLGNTQHLLDMMHADPTTGSAQKVPDAASFKMSLSSVRSATAFFSRAFSRSSSFRRLA